MNGPLYPADRPFEVKPLIVIIGRRSAGLPRARLGCGTDPLVPLIPETSFRWIAEQMIDVLVIFRANVLQQILTEQQMGCALIDCPRLGVRLRIVKGDRDVHTAEGTSPITLNGP